MQAQEIRNRWQRFGPGIGGIDQAGHEAPTVVS